MDSTAESVRTIEVTACMCAEGDCTSGRAGHTVLPIQQRVAAASPSGWRDAIVDRSQADGWVELVLLADERRQWIWNHGTVDVAPGSPVAIHPVAGIVAGTAGYASVLVAA